MELTLKYLPDEGFSLGDIKFIWGTKRELIRDLIQEDYVVSDNIDITFPIVLKRDIYNNFDGNDILLFANYNTDDNLAEIEVHHGFKIFIDSVVVDFSMDIEMVVEVLKSISNNCRRMRLGEYYFHDLKLVVANREAMGGNGTKLSYFYCSQDVSHLRQN